jgi:hypothetical protein
MDGASMGKPDDKGFGQFIWSGNKPVEDITPTGKGKVICPFWRSLSTHLGGVIGEIESESFALTTVRRPIMWTWIYFTTPMRGRGISYLSGFRLKTSSNP